MKTAEVRDKIIRILTQIEAKHYPYPYKKKVVDELLESYVKETAIEFAIDYEDMDFDLAPIEKFKNPDDWHKEYKIKVAQLFDNWYTKHKEG